MNNILTHICVIYSIYTVASSHTYTYTHTRIYICLSPYLIHYPVEIVKDSYNYYYIMYVRCEVGRLQRITVEDSKVFFFDNVKINKAIINVLYDLIMPIKWIKLRSYQL